MATTTTFSNAMKTKFIGPIRDQMHSNKVLLFGLRTRDGDKDQPDPKGSRDWSGIKASAEGIDFVGNEFRIPLRSSRNQGTGGRAENSALPAAGNQGYHYITEPLKYYYGVFNITGQLLKASRSDEGAFKRALSAEMSGVTDDLKRHVNIHAHGAGNAVLATITTGTTSATQPVDTTIHFDGGEVVDIYSSDLTTYRGSAALTVDSFDRSALTITLSSSIATTTNDVIIRASSDSTSSTPNNDKGAAINGLENIVKSTGALHGLNPATAGQTYWASYAKNAAGAVAGDSLLRDVCDNIGFSSGSDEELVAITTRGIRSRYVNTLIAQKRFTNDRSTTLKGGFSAITFDDMPLVIDDSCKLGNVWFLNTGSLFWSEMSDWEWLDEDGDVLKQVPGYDKYVAYLFKYMNLGTTARNRHGYLYGADDDTR